MVHDTITITTFGYLHAPPPDAHITIDLRSHFRDPHVDPALRPMTAHDAPVREAVLATPGIPVVIAGTVAMVRAYLDGPSAGPVDVAVGCQGGRHRAATVGAQVAALLATEGVRATVTHRDLDKAPVDRPVPEAPRAAPREDIAALRRAALLQDGSWLTPRGRTNGPADGPQS